MPGMLLTYEKHQRDVYDDFLFTRYVRFREIAVPG